MTNHKPGWQIASQYKPLTLLARDLRKHAQTHAFDDGQLVADLLAAANNLDVFAIDLERRIDEMDKRAQVLEDLGRRIPEAGL